MYELFPQTMVVVLLANFEILHAIRYCFGSTVSQSFALVNFNLSILS